MSCSSEETSSSSRSGKSTRKLRRSAARCVATACRRKRSGAASQSGRALEEVEGLGGADQRLDAGRASAPRSPAECCGPAARPSARLFASRITAITSATSDSIAVTISVTEGWSWLTTRRTRLRDSASAGNASSASKQRSADGRGPHCAGGRSAERVAGARQPSGGVSVVALPAGPASLLVLLAIGNCHIGSKRSRS